jgi:hypothetical protein
MSKAKKQSLTHSELIEIGARWLKNQCRIMRLPAKITMQQARSMAERIKTQVTTWKSSYLRNCGNFARMKTPSF